MRMSTAGGLEEDKSCKNLDLNNGYNNLDSNTNCDSLDSRNGDKSVDANKKLRDQNSNCDSVLPEYGSRLADFLEKKTKVALLLDFDGTLRFDSGVIQIYYYFCAFTQTYFLTFPL